MKSIIMPVTEQLNEEINHQLPEEVKEKVVIETIVKKKSKQKRFTASEMWNRRRQMRSASDMMRRSSIH